MFTGGQGPRTNGNSPAREVTGHKAMGSLSHRQPSLGSKNINKSLLFTAVDGNISWHPSDDKPFFPVTSANSVTMATASSAMTSYGFLGNHSQCSDVMWSPWQCSIGQEESSSSGKRGQKGQKRAQGRAG